MPFGPYTDWADCVAKNGDKASPEAFCAWMEHELTGAWPAEASKLPPEKLAAYESAIASLKFQEIKTKTVAGVEIFSVGNWTDSAGVKREWTIDDLKSMLAAFSPTDKVPLKMGHTSDAFNRKVAAEMGIPVQTLTGDRSGKGQALLGYASKLTLKGNKLVGDFENVPEVIADMIASGQFNAVSAEIEFIGDSQTKRIAKLVGVAILGVEEPAVENLAGLAAASVFQTKQGAVVYAFAAPKGEIMAESGDSKPKQLWDFVARLFGGKEGEHLMTLTKDSLVKDVKALFQGEDTLTAVAVALGLDPNLAKLGDILMAIQQLKAGGGAGGNGDKMPEGMAAEHSKIKADFATLQKTVEALTTRNADLEKQGRVAHYTRMAEKWTAIAGKPEDIGKQIADIHDKAGEETAKTIVSTYETANKAATEAGILGSRGTARQNSGNGNSEADKKIAEFKKGGLSHEKAVQKLSKEDPSLFRQYQADSIIAPGGNHNG